MTAISTRSATERARALPPAEPPLSEPLSADHVADIATGIAAAQDLWRGKVRHDLPSRHAVRLLAHERYEVWAIGWPADHRTTPHDHGESIGALAVVEGELFERPAGPGEPLERRLGPGDQVPLPVGIIHDVGTTERTATSIHVYSPPLSTMTFYEEVTGLPDRVLDVAEDSVEVDPSAVARVLHPAYGGPRA